MVLFRYYDSSNGRLYANRYEYDREQERVREWRKQQEEKRKIEQAEYEAELRKRTGNLIPSPGYVHGYKDWNHPQQTEAA